MSWLSAGALLVSLAWAMPAAGELVAGAARADITPEVGVSLDGTISKNGPATGMHDRLFARALVVGDDRLRLALVVCDACMIGPDVVEEARRLAEAATGIPAGHQLVAATHTHAAVRAIHVGRQPADTRYHEFLARKIADAVIAANANRAPARIGYGSFDAPRYVRCRRRLCTPGTVGVNPLGETGERVKSVAGTSSAELGPAGPTDPQVSLLSVQHADGSPLAVLANYSVHYAGGYRRGLVSADYFGQFAAAMEAALESDGRHTDFVAMMSNGTSGDTGAADRDGAHYEPFEWMQVCGRALADEARRTLAAIQHRGRVTIGVEQAELKLGVRRPDAARVAWAEALLARPGERGPHRWSRIYAEETLHLAGYPARVPLMLQAMRLGGLAIAAIPCEVFAETGLAIKAESPHPRTFVMSLANGYGGYLPTSAQHALGGYETWPARSSFLEVGAERAIRDGIVELLHRLRP